MQPQQQKDPKIVNLAKAVALTESSQDGATPNYEAVGDAGTSRGAYQWQPGVFESMASKHGLNPSDFSPKNQNEVAYAEMNDLYKRGFTPDQIAAAWNSGEGRARSGAWKENVGTKIINGQEVHFDTPGYVNKVKENYQKLYSQSQQQGIPPEQPEQEKVGTLQKLLNFAFPILEKKERTTKQKFADLALSLSWFIPGGGFALGGALKGAGMGARAAGILGHTLAGAGTGYATDIASRVSGGKDVSESLSPSYGTALGAIGGRVAGGLAEKYSGRGVVNQIAKENKDVLGQTKRGAVQLEKSFSKDKDPALLAAEKQINLKSLVNPETLAYETQDAANNVLGDARKLNEVLTDALSATPGTKPVASLEEEILSKIPKNAPERAAIVKNEMQLLREAYGEAPTLAELNDWKHRAWDKSKFDTAVPDETRKTYRMIGNSLKTDIEKIAEANGTPGVSDMNEYIGSHMDLAEHLAKLNGTKAKGGRIGGLLQQATAQAVGGSMGMASAGPVGAFLGMLGGHYAAKGVGSVLRGIEASPIKTAILKRMVREDPEIVQKMQELVENLSQEPVRGKGLIAPKLAPKEPGKTQVPKIVSNVAARLPQEK